MEAPDTPDHYEILQVSPRAHSLVITRAFRLLVAMYHPDNKETADEEMFRRVVEAYRVLSDPVRRAAYDRGAFGATAEAPHDASLAESEVDGRRLDERQLRQLILQALYANRRGRPERPGLSLMVLSELSGCGIEEMLFTLWYLRGKKFIETGTDEELMITVGGVDHVEAGEGPEGGAPEMLALPPHRGVLEKRLESTPMPSGEGGEPSP